MGTYRGFYDCMAVRGRLRMWCCSRIGNFDFTSRKQLGPGAVHSPGPLGCNCDSVALYGPTPPLWQSEQLTEVRPPSSTGWLNDSDVFTTIEGRVPASWVSTVWQELQSLVMTLPSALLWLPSWQRKQPL